MMIRDMTREQARELRTEVKRKRYIRENISALEQIQELLEKMISLRDHEKQGIQDIRKEVKWMQEYYASIEKE